MKIIKKHIFDSNKDEIYMKSDKGSIWTNIVVDKLNKENNELEYYYKAEK